MSASALNLGDGFEFAEIEVTPMERETPYGGSRFEIHWKMFGKPNSAALRLDICSGDVVNPVSKDFSELSLVPEEDSALTAQIYPAEFIFAEKLETLFRFGTGSTRCKDLIDLWSLSKLDLNPDKLKASVKACFENRQQVLSLERLRTILENDFFIRSVTRLAEANFSSLKLPPIPQLMSEILHHCENTLS